MIAKPPPLLESLAVAHAPRARLPWTLVAASLLFALLLAWSMFGGFLPARRRVTGLEKELKDVYGREAALQTRAAQLEQRLSDLRAEREQLARRVEELEAEVAALRGRR